MRPSTVFLLLLTLAAVTVSFAEKPKLLPDTLVVADALAEENDRGLRPEPGKPIYYLILKKAERVIGNPIVNFPSAKADDVQRELVRVLASQGYVDAKTVGKMPSIFLIVYWGQANANTIEASEEVVIALPNDMNGETLTGEAAEAAAQKDSSIILNTETQTTSTVLNKTEIFDLIGMGKYRRYNTSRSDEFVMNDYLNSNRVYIKVVALDAKAYLKKERKILWRTRISIDSLDGNLVENLSQMLADGASFFGRNEDTVVLVNKAVRNSNVKLGELKILNDDLLLNAPARNTKK